MQRRSRSRSVEICGSLCKYSLLLSMDARRKVHSFRHCVPSSNSVEPSCKSDFAKLESSVCRLNVTTSLCAYVLCRLQMLPRRSRICGSLIMNFSVPWGITQTNRRSSQLPPILCIFLHIRTADLLQAPECCHILCRRNTSPSADDFAVSSVITLTRSTFE